MQVFVVLYDIEHREGDGAVSEIEGIFDTEEKAIAFVNLEIIRTDLKPRKFEKHQSLLLWEAKFPKQKEIYETFSIDEYEVK